MLKVRGLSIPLGETYIKTAVPNGTRMDVRQAVSELCENFLRFQSDT